MHPAKSCLAYEVQSRPKQATECKHGAKLNLKTITFKAKGRVRVEQENVGHSVLTP